MRTVKSSTSRKRKLRVTGSLTAGIIGIGLLVAASACGASNDMDKHKPPPTLGKAVGCLVADPLVRKYGLDYLNLKVGDWAWARYTVGSIRGTEKTPELVNVVIYAPDANEGMLLFADPNKHGGFDAIPNAYRLKKHGSKWAAGYGNGGYAVYEAISKYATRLEKQPRYRVHLVPGGSECGAIH